MEHTIRHIGRRIKRLRKAKGLTADALARQVGITENAVRKLEAGDSSEPRFSTGIRMADVLGTSPHALAGQRRRSSDQQDAPELASVIRRIREVRHRLTERGAGHIAIFGSVARGEARPNSDVDIIVEPSSPDRFSLVSLGLVSDILEEVLQSRVDVLSVETVRQSRFAEAADEEAVVVF